MPDTRNINDLPSGQAVGQGSGTQQTFPADGALQVANNAGTSYFQLVAEAANTIAVRNGTNAQSLHVYRTYTDASNYERLKIGVNGSNFRVAAEKAGTGFARNLEFVADASVTFSGYGLPTLQFHGGGARFQGGVDVTSIYGVTFENGSFVDIAGIKAPSTGLVQITDGSSGLGSLSAANLTLKPSASVTPTNNGELIVEATSNTTLTIKLKGSDGTVRSTTLTLT